MSVTVEEAVRVLVADDQTLFRNVLARMLASDPRVRVVGQARDGEEAVEQAREGRPDVILMDLQMPRMTGVEATRLLARDMPDIRVLALSAFASEGMVEDAIASGARGFVEKDVTFDEILTRILEVAPARRPRNVQADLTPRETEVLKQVAAGLSNKQIGKRLGLSEKTVRNHLSRAFGKLGATNRTEAVMHAMRAGLVTASPASGR